MTATEQTVTPDDPPLPLEISVDDYGPSIDRVGLFLVPAAENDGIPRVYTYGSIGSSMPMPAWHRRHLCVASVPLTTVGTELAEWIREHGYEFHALSDMYEGASWDGSNMIGRWRDTDDRHRCCEDIAERISQLPQYWDAAEWFAPCESLIVETALSHGSIEIAAEDEVEAARPEAFLDPTDTFNVVRGLVEKHRDELDEKLDPDNWEIDDDDDPDAIDWPEHARLSAERDLCNKLLGEVAS